MSSSVQYCSFATFLKLEAKIQLTIQKLFILNRHSECSISEKNLCFKQMFSQNCLLTGWESQNF